VVVCAVVHAALSPVTEWDAAIYHAGAAKLWFLEAPSPPVLAGPSVGIEISGDYPPLFPATGLTFDVVIGRFQDAYLRLISPLLLCALALMLYGYVSRRVGSRAAAWALILTVCAPLVILYGTWATGYMLLTALWFAVVLLCDAAAVEENLPLWVGAGAAAGLAVLTHFYGLPVIAAGPVAFALVRISWRNAVGAALFLVVAGLVASPWLLRNAVVLHDPLYPVPIPFFDPIGLTEPLWSASQAEIRNNALGQWNGTLPIAVQQLATALFDRHLLVIGMLFGIAIGLWRGLRGDRFSGYLLTLIAIFIGVLMAPGWYWLRGLLPIIPIAAALSGQGIATLMDSDRLWRFRRPPPVRSAMGITTIAIFATSALVGGSLAVAGPNQDTWTTLLDGTQNDMMAGVRDLGSDPASLYNVYGGDYLAWSWLNAHLTESQRVATLDNRLYYFSRPQDLFYLDGSEAVGLVTIDDSSTAREFLASRGIRYVMVPGWASSPGPTQHPAVRLLPFLTMLGKADFPVAAVFVDNYSDPTVIYSVGPYAVPVEPAIFLGRQAGLPPLGAGPFSISRNDTAPRIVAPAINGKPTALKLQYRLAGAAALSINRWDPDRRLWIDGIFTTTSRGDFNSWQSAEIPLDITSGYVTLGLYASGGNAQIQDVSVVNPIEPIVNGDIATSGPDPEYTVSSRDTSNRIFVPATSSGTRLLTFQYADEGSGGFDLNYYNPQLDQWTTIKSFPLRNTGAWLTAAAELIGGGDFEEYAIHDNGPDLRIRTVTTTADPVIVSPVARDAHQNYLFPQGATSGRILVPMFQSRPATLTLTYLDNTGAFGMNILDPASSASWSHGRTIFRTARSSWKTVVISLGAGPSRVVEIGPISYRGTLVIRDATITLGSSGS